MLLLLSFFGVASAFFRAAPRSAFGRGALRMAVSKKDSYEITLLTGDGIGPEITVRRVSPRLAIAAQRARPRTPKLLC